MRAPEWVEAWLEVFGSGLAIARNSWICGCSDFLRPATGAGSTLQDSAAHANPRPCFAEGPTCNLPGARFSHNLKAMEVHFTPEQEAKLARIATTTGTDAERLVKDAALRLLEEDARFRAAVREGIAQADRGEFIEEEEMDARFEEMLRS